MKNCKTILVIILCVIVFLEPSQLNAQTSHNSPSNEDRIWEKIRETNSFELYLGYIINNPDGKYVAEAKRLMGEIRQKTKNQSYEAPVVLKYFYDYHANNWWKIAKEKNDITSYWTYCLFAMFGEHYDQANERWDKLCVTDELRESKARVDLLRRAVRLQGNKMKVRQLSLKGKRQNQTTESNYDIIHKQLISDPNDTKTQIDLIVASWSEAEPVLPDPDNPIAWQLNFSGVSDGKGGYKELSSIELNVHLIQKGGESIFCPIYINAKIEKGSGSESIGTMDGQTGIIRLDFDNISPKVSGIFSPTGSKPYDDLFSSKINGFVLAPDNKFVGSYFYASIDDNRLLTEGTYQSKTTLTDDSKWVPIKKDKILLFKVIKIDGVLHLKIMP